MPDEELVLRREPGLMELVQQVINSPNARDQVEVVKAMLDMKERMEDRSAKQEFAQALHDMQSKIPPITKDGVIKDKNKVIRSRYATIDQIDDALRPLMDEFGFSFQLSEGSITEGGMREFLGTLIHKAGYEKTLIVRLPLDKSEFRSAVQSEGATLSYARRQLYKQHFNIVERSQENPESVEPITADQLKDLETKIQDTKASVKAFCGYFNIESVRDLKKADLSTAHEMLDQRIKKQKELAEQQKAQKS